MTSIKATPKRKVLVGVAAAAVVVGVVVAILATGGHGSAQPSAAAPRAASPAAPGDLAAAASYLGISPAQLRAELRSGKTLAEIASSTRGKSVHGLIDAAAAARKAQLAAEVAAGAISPAQEKTRISTLARRTAETVGRAAPIGEVPVAAHYLGLSRSQIRAELRSGKSLAQIAAASGKSSAGLIEAMVAARKARLAAEAAAGSLSQAEESELVSTLDRRVTAKVEAKRGQGAPGTSAAAPTSTQAQSTTPAP